MNILDDLKILSAKSKIDKVATDGTDLTELEVQYR